MKIKLIYLIILLSGIFKLALADTVGPIRSMPPNQVGHNSWVSSVAFSPDGRYVYSGSDDRTLKVWESGIRINQPPKASFTINPNTGFVPLTAQLDASASTDDGNITKYQ